MNYKNLNLNQKSKTFIEKYEEDYGMEIKLFYKVLENNRYGYTKFIKNVPAIFIHPEVENKEEVVIHETYHLRLQLDGMPKIRYSPTSRFRHQFDHDYFTWFTTRFWDKISHYYFFPKMLEELDVNPYLRGQKSISATIANGKLNLENVTEIGIAGLMFQAWIECNDELLLQNLVELLQQKYESVGVDKGKYLINLMKNKPLVDFTTCVKVYEEMFNYLHQEEKINISINHHFIPNKETKEYIAIGIVDCAINESVG